MKLQLSATGVIALAGVGVVGLLAWRLWNGGKLVTESLNPASSNNVVNQAVEAFGQSLTGDPYWSLGGGFYDLTHSDPTDPTRFTGLDWANPVSDKNLVYQGVSAVGQAATGSKDWSLGTWLYDITHP